MLNTPNEGCMGFMGGVNEPGSYCEAIRTLYSEHIPLTQQMDQILVKAEQVRAVEELAELTALVETFKKGLECHSCKEEEGLFPILGRHIGTQFGPIAVMEYEHSEAKRYIGEYLTKQSNLPSAITADFLADLSLSIIRGIRVLMDHFKKEENILFPMAEKALTAEEKAELLAIVKF